MKHDPFYFGDHSTMSIEKQYVAYVNSDLQCIDIFL